MEKDEISGNVVREFKLTTLSLKNRNTVILLTLLLALFGMIAYNTMPMESFPEVNMPQVFVKTVYPGNAPVDMENLITRPLEKELHSVKGIKELRSNSTQDNSNITVEFNTGVEISDALQDVKDAVDKAKSELPNDLDMDPMVMDFDINEMPIININLSGDYSLTELKEFAEYLEDEIEAFPEISKVNIKGLNEREIQVHVDPHKLETLELSFKDIEDAVAFENISIAGGDLIVDKTTRSIRTSGEFTNLEEIEDIIIKNEKGNIVYLRDVAEIRDGYEDPLTFARLDRKPVVSLDVLKRAGENLLNATDKIFTALARGRENGALPKNLTIDLANDQSDMVRKMVDNLENSIIMGVLFVILVLFFFLGLRNSLFVGIAIPMSMFISFVILGLMGSTINMMVLFGMVLALGMLVDNAIVVVENIYRFIHQGYSLFNAAKTAVGEIAMPIIASTATTLAAFFPLVFWEGLIGEFMKHLPITLIIVLTSSLFVALVIIPVLASRLIKKTGEESVPTKRRSFYTAGAMLGIAVPFYLAGSSGTKTIGSLLLFGAILVLLNLFFLHRAAHWFQTVFLNKMENFYLKILRWLLKGIRPYILLVGTVFLMIFVMMFFGARQPKVVFFPVSHPNFVNVFAELPVGTDIQATNEFMYKLEGKIYEVIEPYRGAGLIKSVLTSIGKGVKENPLEPDINTPHKGLTIIYFVDYEDRGGIDTRDVMKELSNQLLGKYPGVKISVVKDDQGPPTGKPISIEITGKDFKQLIALSENIQQHLEEEHVPGVEGIKMNMDAGMPELLVNIDRERARRFGLSTAQVASTIRTALFGKEVSDYKEGEDEYPIKLRLLQKYRNDISALMNMRVTFRNQATGKIVQIPISSVASFNHSTTYNAVNRVDMQKSVTLWSNVIEGFNPSDINDRLKEMMSEYKMPAGYEWKFTGEQEEQAETSAFLVRALLIALSLVMMIMVTQFNSFSKPFIIMSSVLFSTIGVFGGLATFKMDFVVIMTGIGIISLAGVVVNNAIVLIDYINFLKSNRKARMGMGMDDHLSIKDAYECIVQGGRTRLRPVLLTAITTILGLLPMAIGLNINFATLLSDLNPQIYFGGDNSIFWGPMAWTVIFGLSFATFLTLLVVPAMYLIGNKIKLKALERMGKI